MSRIWEPPRGARLIETIEYDLAAPGPGLYYSTDDQGQLRAVGVAERYKDPRKRPWEHDPDDYRFAYLLRINPSYRSGTKRARTWEERFQEGRPVLTTNGYSESSDDERPAVESFDDWVRNAMAWLVELARTT